VPLPEWCFRVRARGKDYYYHQVRRGHADAGPRTRLPDVADPHFFAAVAALQGARPAGKGSLRSVWEAWIAGPRKPKTAGTLATYRSAWAILDTAWGDLPPRVLTKPKIAELHDRLAGRASMANMVLIVLRQVLGEAARMGLVETNAADGLRPHIIESIDGAKPVTEAAWAALMHADCPRPVYRLAVLMRATGQRISDAHRMTPDMREGDGIRHAIKKRARKITSFWSYVAPGYLAEIDDWKGFPRAPYVACEGRVTENRLREAWNAYAATERGAALRGFTPHDLRATNFCDHVLAGTELEDIARMRGVTVAIVRRYTQHLDVRKFVKSRGNGA
jgi:integrase